jgi:hypothetical protein
MVTTNNSHLDTLKIAQRVILTNLSRFKMVKIYVTKTKGTIHPIETKVVKNHQNGLLCLQVFVVETQVGLLLEFDGLEQMPNLNLIS